MDGILRFILAESRGRPLAVLAAARGREVQDSWVSSPWEACIQAAVLFSTPPVPPRPSRPPGTSSNSHIWPRRCNLKSTRSCKPVIHLLLSSRVCSFSRPRGHRGRVPSPLQRRGRCQQHLKVPWALVLPCPLSFQLLIPGWYLRVQEPRKAATEVSASPASEPLVPCQSPASRKKIAKHFPAGDPAELGPPHRALVCGWPPSRPVGQPC